MTNPDARVDIWFAYDYHVPGVFILRAGRYPTGSAQACGFKAPHGIEPLIENIEQQAVTPISDNRTAYHFATGLTGKNLSMTVDLASRLDVVLAAFDEDRDMIQAQQKIWDLTLPDTQKLYLPQDKGPYMMRQLLARLIDKERAGDQIVSEHRAEQSPQPVS